MESKVLVNTFGHLFNNRSMQNEEVQRSSGNHTINHKCCRQNMLFVLGKSIGSERPGTDVHVW